MSAAKESAEQDAVTERDVETAETGDDVNGDDAGAAAPTEPDPHSGHAPGWRTHASFGTGPAWTSTPAYGRGNYEPGPGYRSEVPYGTPPGVDGPQQRRPRGRD